MKKIITCLAAALLSVSSVFGQKALDKENLELVEKLNNRGFYRPSCQWLYEDSRMESYIGMIGQFSAEAKNDTRRAIADDREKAQKIVNLKKAIVGKNKKAKKQDEAIAKYFPNLDEAHRIFGEAEAVLKRCDKLQDILGPETPDDYEPGKAMPKGKLLSYESSTSNGFAARRFDLKLWRDKEGKGWLSCNTSFMNREAKAIEVGDSVFQRVRDMAEENKLYTIGHTYMPDYEIMDASNWSLSVQFEGGSISSSGYATGPSKSLGRSEIQRYLVNIYREQVPEEEDSDERFHRR